MNRSWTDVENSYPFYDPLSHLGRLVTLSGIIGAGATWRAYGKRIAKQDSKFDLPRVSQACLYVEYESDSAVRELPWWWATHIDQELNSALDGGSYLAIRCAIWCRDLKVATNSVAPPWYFNDRIHQNTSPYLWWWLIEPE